MAQTQTFSKNQRIVLDIVEKAKGPLKAYSILFNVQKKGINAPQQIYRALDKLIEAGKIHKIESKNAFVACSKINCSNQNSTFFLICDDCENIIELEDQEITDQLNKTCERLGSTYKNHTIEISGTCSNCN